MFQFKIIKQSKNSSLRTGVISTPHGDIKTPVFMPVGTVGAVKTVAPWELQDLGAEIILGNTYHLYLRPGENLIKEFDGLAAFNHWNGPILTDSGGFQVFSLGAGKKNKKGESLVKISNDGVEFQSHLDGSKHIFTPEKVVDIQLSIGSDIIMPLDVCPPSKASYDEVKQAVDLSIEWLKRSKVYLNSKKLQSKPALFGIVQGGIYSDLRKYCAEEMIKLDLPGYSIGGLAVGESQAEMLEVIKALDNILPKNKPRYLMGVGTLDDIKKATALGVDMFDCVLPTRLGRHGVAVLMDGNDLNLASGTYRQDRKTIDIKCQCPACKEGFSRAYLHHLVKEKEILGVRLLTLHNLYSYISLIKNIRALV